MLGIIYGNISAGVIYFLKCLIFIVPFMIIEILIKRKNNLRISKSHLVGELVFVYLIVFMLEFTTISSLARILFIGIEIHPETFNFIPFSSITKDVLPYITNIILFIPFGLLCPILWENQQSIKKVAFAGFLLSLTIESSQIFSMRVTDVDDLLMNTTGAVIGYLIFRVFNNAIRFKNGFMLANNNLPLILKHEGWFLIYIVFAFEFFLLPYI